MSDSQEGSVLLSTLWLIETSVLIHQVIQSSKNVSFNKVQRPFSYVSNSCWLCCFGFLKVKCQKIALSRRAKDDRNIYIYKVEL